MSKELTHWRKLQNPNYIGSYAFQPEEEKDLTISRSTYEQVTNSDGKKEECHVIYFEEKNIKPLIVNVTNASMISKVVGSPYVENWIGKRITLYVANIRAFGEDMEAVRVRPRAPKANKPVLDEKYKGWGQALQAVKNGESTVSFLQEHYSFTAASKKALLEAEGEANA